MNTFKKFWFCLFFSGILIQAKTQCLISEGHFFLNYNSASCNDLNFQYAIGAIVLPYGECNDYDYASPLYNPNIMTKNKEFSTIQNFTLFPNPFHSDFIIRFSEIQKIKSIQIFSSLGELIQTYTINSEIKEFPVNGDALSSSCYFVRIHFYEGQSITKSILKMNIH
jgi:hypothetical protein